MNSLYRKSLLTILISSFFAMTANAQTLKIRSNSEKKLKVTAYGVNKEGKQVSIELNNVDLGYWRTLSLYKAKYGYDLYHNKNMKKSGADVSNHWTRMVVELKGTDQRDEIDLTGELDEAKLSSTKLWLRLQQKFDGDYQLTTVSFYDRHK